ncbi:MAG: class I SAM-dependent methyltransferase [Lachnospiraceae bacterium]|nr:class I SAM-dependent methyltransferase [Lachnospiraceae bacterium]
MENRPAEDAKREYAECMIRMVNDLGFPLAPGMKILDFGCGDGSLVTTLRGMGYDAYGVDIIDCPALDAEHYARIGFDPYRFPYADDTFDFVHSSSVFEHVQNTEECLKEIHRVLKPGGATVHSLPSRYRLLEAHMFVPLGGLIQSPFWLWLWAFLGVKNGFQKGLSGREVYRRNLGYCRSALNYYSYRDLKKIILSVFGNVKAVGKEYINNMPGGAARLGRKLRIPGYSRLVFLFREWELFMKKEG